MDSYSINTSYYTVKHSRLFKACLDWNTSLLKGKADLSTSVQFINVFLELDSESYNN